MLPCRTARLWNGCQAQPLIDFSHVNRHAPKTPGLGDKAKDNPAFVNDVTAARFLFMDQFVLLASGSKLHLYR